jgi:integrase
MAHVRKLPSGKWQGLYYDPARRKRTAGVFTTKKVALDAAREEERRIPRQTWTDPALARVPFSEWAAHHISTMIDQRDSTRVRDDSYLRTHLLPAFGNFPIGGIEPLDVQRWVTKLSASGLAPATVAICYRLMARIMTAAVESDYISRTPCRGVRLPRIQKEEMRFLSPQELGRLAVAAPARHRAPVLTAGYIGLRWGEIAGLKRRRLNLLRGTIEIAETLTEGRGTLGFGEPKTKASRRTLTLPRFLVEELQAHLEKHSTNPELVFSGRDGGPLRRNNSRRRVWLPAVEATGLAPLRFHDLRHTAAGLMIANKV